MDARKYRSPDSLLDAINQRIRTVARTENVDANRLRRHVAFDRLLARIFQVQEASWLLKGGYAMELRLENSRATIDVDLALYESNLYRLMAKEQSDAVYKLLIQAAKIDLGDHFKFEIAMAKRNLLSPPYGGARYSITTTMAGITFVRFHLDVGVGDPRIEPHVRLKNRDWLSFAGIICPTFPAISAEQQFAEKLYVYTIPRKNFPNSRAKDLIDMLLLVQSGKLKIETVQLALQVIFKRYNTHTLPTSLSPPPSEWSETFNQLAEQCKLETTLTKAFVIVEKFYNKITRP